MRILNLGEHIPGWFVVNRCRIDAAGVPSLRSELQMSGLLCGCCARLLLVSWRWNVV